MTVESKQISTPRKLHDIQYNLNQLDDILVLINFSLVIVVILVSIGCIAIALYINGIPEGVAWKNSHEGYN